MEYTSEEKVIMEDRKKAAEEFDKKFGVVPKSNNHYIHSQLPFWFLIFFLLGIVGGMGVSWYLDNKAKSDSVKLGGVVIQGKPYSLTEIIRK
jgi:hypothetical protein